ncbi:MAG: sulfatase-like hydrolase/transferase, partial [Kiritimatiellaeota bacterium]|nr:sulfatase-like hydrolase/transferase [Kiritimatiellota bacterium]
QLDTRHGQSVRLTDFHVGTTCSPSRASLMTGRAINAAGVWHTVAGRELLRENEQTMAEVFRSNGWKTGIFGKWHLGDGYPFSPRFRGFDESVIHGGGGVGQGPDYWGNDYYSGVDRNGKPNPADVYMENGQPVKADRFCTDYWFDRAKQFIRQCAKEKKSFFCYLPTNAAHEPFNAPRGGKGGFDGLIENIDANMGQLDEFLAAEGLKDDVLLIFTSDNGTTGGRRGGLRGNKGSLYDGGHNVPCYWRWKNGGIGGSAAAARDVKPLTAAMDFLPTFIELFGLTRPAGGRPLHGISLKPMLLDPAFVPAERAVVVDTQRLADLKKWRLACVMQDEVAGGAIAHKWRLVRGSAGSKGELYDFLTDRGEDTNVAAAHGAVVADLTAKYEAWWADVSPGAEAYPPFVLNPDREAELTLFSHSWIGGDLSPWSQHLVSNAAEGTRTHAVRFDRAGRYRFELRRWPREDGGAITGPNSAGGGKVVPATKARLAVLGVGAMTNTLHAGDAMAVFEMDVPAGPPTRLETALLDADDQVLAGAYYVYIRRAAADQAAGELPPGRKAPP